ncbi:hypothetical protein DL96DRAFT_808674 [Flagelloscypha sp. PMI_526]|nr:hypothetical protein DL96DRAFT_808674 [Flagelloscypha sp. PMI_526]
MNSISPHGWGIRGIFAPSFVASWPTLTLTCPIETLEKQSIPVAGPIFYAPPFSTCYRKAKPIPRQRNWTAFALDAVNHLQCFSRHVIIIRGHQCLGKMMFVYSQSILLRVHFLAQPKSLHFI